MEHSHRLHFALFLLVPRIGLVGVGFACVAGWIVMLGWQAPYCIYIRKKMINKTDKA